MPRFRNRREKKVGLSPGTLVHVGERPSGKVRITIIDYDEAHLEVKEARTVEECFPFKESPTVTWVNVDGIHQVEVVEKIGKHFDIHPLILEDIVTTGQRPKMDDLGWHLFVVLKMLSYNEAEREITAEQVSLILGSNFVLVFQESDGDVFNPVRERIRSARGRIRKMGADYLAYALIDAIVDGYFGILEKIGEDIESLEEELIADPGPETLQTIYDLKREMIYLRRSVWPLREVISALQRKGSSLISESTGIFLRDVYDHTIQVIETIEAHRDMVAGMLEIYLSSVSNRMNEVMKVLTLIATIFIPLTFLAGVYGMNFDFMPELKWRWGYFVAWGVMIAAGLGMFIYFKKRRWI